MAHLATQRHLSENQIAVSGNPITTEGRKTLIANNNPNGDESIIDQKLVLRGNLNLATSSAGTIVTDGEKLNVRSIDVSTDKHGDLIKGVDGIALDRYNRYINGTAPLSSSIAAATTGTPTFETGLLLPFAHRTRERMYDGLLYMGKARQTIGIDTGPATDFLSGGTYTTQQIQALTAYLSANVLENPAPAILGANGEILDPKEDPLFQLSLEMFQVPVNAAASEWQIQLPYNDRILHRIWIFQRNGSTRAEMTGVISDTGRVSVVVNNKNWVDRKRWGDIRSENKDDFSIESLATGAAVIQFGKRGRIDEMLSLLSRNDGNAKLLVDVNSVANGQLWIMLESWKPIREAARR